MKYSLTFFCPYFKCKSLAGPFQFCVASDRRLTQYSSKVRKIRKSSNVCVTFYVITFCPPPPFISSSFLFSFCNDKFFILSAPRSTTSRPTTFFSASCRPVCLQRGNWNVAANFSNHLFWQVKELSSKLSLAPVSLSFSPFSFSSLLPFLSFRGMQSTGCHAILIIVLKVRPKLCGGKTLTFYFFYPLPDL